MDTISVDSWYAARAYKERDVRCYWAQDIEEVHQCLSEHLEAVRAGNPGATMALQDFKDQRKRDVKDIMAVRLPSFYTDVVLIIWVAR